MYRCSMMYIIVRILFKCSDHEIKTKLLENIEDVKNTVDISFHIDRSTLNISVFGMSLFS